MQVNRDRETVLLVTVRTMATHLTRTTQSTSNTTPKCVCVERKKRLKLVYFYSSLKCSNISKFNL